VAGRKPSRLRAALEHLLGRSPPWEAGWEAGVPDLLYHVCLAAGIHEDRCADIMREYKEAMAFEPGPDALSRVTAAFKLRTVMEKVNEVLDRFELRGRCLVEKGVGVKDPSVCEGDLDGGLLIVGSGMQFLVDGEVRTAVARMGDLCAVALGRGEVGYWALDELKAGRAGLLGHDGSYAVISVRGCRVEDMPRLAERAAKVPYREIFKRCEAFGDEAAEGKALSKAEEREIDECLKLLGELERGGGS
jgi:hypothetical protein